MAWMREKIKIPKGFAPKVRREIGEEIVELIRQRTESGMGVVKIGEGKWRHKQFPPYSKAYVESLEFKIAGKSKNRVNLTLSGDMLASLDVLDHSDGEILIGFERGSQENDRAEGNIKGSYGGKPNPRKARNFLGITPGELAEILEKYESRRG